MCYKCHSPYCCSPSTCCAQVVVGNAATVDQLNTLKAAICAKFTELGDHPDEVDITALTVAASLPAPSDETQAVVRYNPTTGQIFLWDPVNEVWIQYGISQQIQKEMTTGAAVVTFVVFEGDPGDVTVTDTPASALTTIVVANGARLVSWEVRGQQGDLLANEYRVIVSDPAIPALTHIPLMQVIDGLDTVSPGTPPTTLAPWSVSYDNPSDIEFYDLNAGTQTIRFKSLASMPTWIVRASY